MIIVLRRLWVSDVLALGRLEEELHDSDRTTRGYGALFLNQGATQFCIPTDRSCRSSTRQDLGRDRTLQ